MYKGSRLIFSSRKAGLAPLLQFLDEFSPDKSGPVFLDRVVGNAAALLLVKAGCAEVYSDTGSELASTTLRQAGVKFAFKQTVPRIMDRRGDDMCPMERLSQGKTPESFWQALQSR